MKYFLLFFLLLLPLSSAATITGTVYDYSLQPVTNAIVTITTVPEQTTVTKNGEYSLEVPAGKYSLKVHKASPQGLQQQAETKITVPMNGTYTYDLILFQELQEIDDHEEIEALIKDKEPIPSWVPVMLGAVIILGLGLFLYKKTKKAVHKEEEEDLESDLLTYIKQQKTTTQKDIRKQFPYSEAKISLIISSLVQENKIIKIKKGRGNIIKYNKER